MTELEDKLSRVLSGAERRAPQAPVGLLATVKTRQAGGGPGPPPFAQPRPWP